MEAEILGFTTHQKWGEGSIGDWEYSCCYSGTHDIITYRKVWEIKMTVKKYYCPLWTCLLNYNICRFLFIILQNHLEGTMSLIFSLRGSHLLYLRIHVRHHKGRYRISKGVGVRSTVPAKCYIAAHLLAHVLRVLLLYEVVGFSTQKKGRGWEVLTPRASTWIRPWIIYSDIHPQQRQIFLFYTVFNVKLMPKKETLIWKFPKRHPSSFVKLYHHCRDLEDTTHTTMDPSL